MNLSKVSLIIAMLIFGSIGLFARNINLASGQLALVRGMIGSVFLFAACFALKQKPSWEAIKRNLFLLILSGAAIGFNWIFMFEAYQYTSIANATLSYYFSPVFVMFLSPFLLKERLSPSKIICILAALAGMFLIVGIGGGEGKNHLIGISFGLAAAVLYASVVIMNKYMKGLSGLETTLIQIGSASIVLLPYVLITEEFKVFTLNQKSLLFLLLLGIVHTGLAYLLYFTAIRKLKGQTIAVFSYIDPISAVFMSSLFLQERLTVVQVIGGALILGATFICEMYDRRQD